MSRETARPFRIHSSLLRSIDDTLFCFGAWKSLGSPAKRAKDCTIYSADLVFRWYKSIKLIRDVFFLLEVTLCNVWVLKPSLAEHAAACSSFAYRPETRVNSASNSGQKRANNAKRRRAPVMLQRLLVLACTRASLLACQRFSES
jgi:hypothetical protein